VATPDSLPGSDSDCSFGALIQTPDCFRKRRLWAYGALARASTATIRRTVSECFWNIAFPGMTTASFQRSLPFTLPACRRGASAERSRLVRE